MNKLQNIIENIQKDLTPLKISHEDFLALSVVQRLQEKSLQYDKEFDKLLDYLAKCELYEKDIIKLTQSLRYYSELITLIYSKLTSKIVQNQNNLLGSNNE